MMASGRSGPSLHAAGLTLALLMMAAGLAALVQVFGWEWIAGKSVQTASAQGGGAIARRLIVYRLDRQVPTTFRFSLPMRQLRIVTQPVLKPASASPGEAWVYAIRAELLDENGAVFSSQAYFVRTIMFERDGRRRGPLRYYRGSNELLPLGDDLQIASARPFAAVRLIIESIPPDILAVDARVSERRPLIDSVAESAFVRLSPDDRVRLAGANAFPPEVLTRDERVNIARNQWRPVGPIGIDGRDYHMRVLYEEEEAGKPGEPAEPIDAEAGGGG